MEENKTQRTLIFSDDYLFFALISIHSLAITEC